MTIYIHKTAEKKRKLKIKYNRWSMLVLDAATLKPLFKPKYHKGFMPDFCQNFAEKDDIAWPQSPLPFLMNFCRPGKSNFKFHDFSRFSMNTGTITLALHRQAHMRSNLTASQGLSLTSKDILSLIWGLGLGRIQQSNTVLKTTEWWDEDKRGRSVHSHS